MDRLKCKVYTQESINGTIKLILRKTELLASIKT